METGCTKPAHPLLRGQIRVAFIIRHDSNFLPPRLPPPSRLTRSPSLCGGRMKTPKRLLPLLEEGLIDEVIGQLMSGKEATVYVVRSGDSTRCAKVYKDAKQRSFRQAATYRDGRKVKNSREARALEKGSRYGREVQEQLWQNAEVDALFRLANAGVRVPQPYICTDGVLLMELVVDAEGEVAPRLNDVDMSHDRALELHAALLREVVRMLCAGVIH